MKTELQNFLLIVILILITVAITFNFSMIHYNKKIKVLETEITQKDSIIHSFLGTGTE